MVNTHFHMPITKNLNDIFCSVYYQCGHLSVRSDASVLETTLVKRQWPALYYDGRYREISWDITRYHELARRNQFPPRSKPSFWFLSHVNCQTNYTREFAYLYKDWHDAGGLIVTSLRKLLSKCSPSHFRTEHAIWPAPPSSRIFLWSRIEEKHSL
jgi:hypothetical protein